MHASWRTCKLADPSNQGLVRPNTVGSIRGRHDSKVVRHQAQAATQHCDPATSRPPFDVLKCSQPGAVIVTARQTEDTT